MRNGCGNDGPWTPRKTKPRFPSAPTALGNRWRDSHIPTAATSQWKNGKPKAGFPLSHCPPAPYPIEITNSKRRPGGGSLRSRLQAHSSIRKCSGLIIIILFSESVTPVAAQVPEIRQHSRVRISFCKLNTRNDGFFL